MNINPITRVCRVRNRVAMQPLSGRRSHANAPLSRNRRAGSTNSFFPAGNLNRACSHPHTTPVYRPRSPSKCNAVTEVRTGGGRREYRFQHRQDYEIQIANRSSSHEL
ncbi:hypothetical protein MRX96_036784 [Rhipicephalus microplus]